jgi:hypothetical protein
MIEITDAAREEIVKAVAGKGDSPTVRIFVNRYG